MIADLLAPAQQRRCTLKSQPLHGAQALDREQAVLYSL